MKMKNLVFTDLQRALLSWRFLLCIFGFTGIMLAAVSGFYSHATSVWYLLYYSIKGSGTASLLLCVIPVLPFAVKFATEWEDSAVSFWIIRTGVTRYTLSKIIVSAVSGFLTIAGSIVLFILVLRLWYPLFSKSITSDIYNTLMEQGYVIKGLLSFTIHVGLSGVLTAVCAMWVSTYLPNRFVVAAAPVVLHFTLLRMTSGLELPGYLYPTNWVEGIYYTASPVGTLMIKLTTVLVVCTILCIAATLQMKRRISHA